MIIGVVATPDISVGGGFARVCVELISCLKSLGNKVYFLTPFEVDLQKVERMHGKFAADKIYSPKGIRKYLNRPDGLARRALKKDFQKLARKVDLIIDLDGGTLHKYLPKEMRKNRYIVWRISCPHDGKTHIPLKLFNWKNLMKGHIRSFFDLANRIPKEHIKVIAIDSWTKKELIENWGIKPYPDCLLPPIRTDNLRYKKERKKKQIIVFGRISANKSVDDSIKIFSRGIKEFPEYNLVILGGTTPDSGKYIKYLKNVSHEEGVSEKVSFIPDPSFDKLSKILKESEILIDSQTGVSLTMTAIEALSAGCIVLAAKDGGTYLEVLDKGKYGFGFGSIQEGSKSLKNIVKLLNEKKLNNKKFIKRADFFSHEMFIKRLGKIINGN